MAVTTPLNPWTQPLAGRWTFWADRYNGEPLGSMVATGVRYNSSLSKFGTGEATISVTESPLERADLLRLWSWRLWVLYEGEPYWCGMPSSVRDDTGPVVQLGFTEVHGYLGRRVLDDEGGVRYDQTEQTEIARQLAWPVTEVDTSVVVDPGPGFLRDRSYAYLEGPYRSNLLENLSNVISGPEFRMEYRRVGARPVATLRIAYPRVGGNQSALGLAVPGNAVGPALTYDGEKLRTRTFAVGEQPEHEAEEPGEEPGEPTEAPERPVWVVDRPQPMSPRLDYIDDWPGVVLIETLQERAETNSRLYASAALSVTGSVTETDPPLGSYDLGDDVTVSILDQFHTERLTATGRLVGVDVDCAAGSVGWTVTIPPGVPITRDTDGQDLPPAEIRPTTNGRIAGLERDVAAVFRRRPRPALPEWAPRGRVASANGPASQADFGTEGGTVMSLNWTAETGRRYRISYFCASFNSGPGVGTNQRLEARHQSPGYTDDEVMAHSNSVVVNFWLSGAAIQERALDPGSAPVACTSSILGYGAGGWQRVPADSAWIIVEDIGEY